MEVNKLNPPENLCLHNITTIYFVIKQNLTSQSLVDFIQQMLDINCQILIPDELHTNGSEYKETDLILLNVPDFGKQKLLEAIGEIFSLTPGSSIAVINIDRNNPDYEIIKWPNVKGIFHIDDTHQILIEGIKSIDSHKSWLPRHYSEYLASLRKCPPMSRVKELVLTRKECEIFNLLVKGLNNQEMAKELFVSPHTIKTHIYTIYKKVGVKNRIQALKWWQETAALNSR